MFELRLKTVCHTSIWNLFYQTVPEWIYSQTTSLLEEILLYQLHGRPL